MSWAQAPPAPAPTAPAEAILTVPLAAGTYSLRVPANASIHYYSDRVLIQWAGVPPGPAPPPPDPQPVPPPTPPPSTLGRLHVVFVTDYHLQPTDPDARRQAELRTSATIRDALRPLNAVWHVLDHESKELDAYGYKRKVDAIGPPCLLITADAPDGRGVWVMEPAKWLGKEADVIAEVKKYRGTP